ncbi:hypothetical protein JL193_16805 [Polaribacter batillariae]|uniref:Uncharacterized protein n=1 Tax=Polaribacter batillariae TaxID=2808900 RepID=A0ABX7STX1_9FLAO|nr:hypothetical protein [Polaribacter batillariae]QTD37697.1 hypothetical protein JL193_16805 [Polaribacter batillariae]
MKFKISLRINKGLKYGSNYIEIINEISKEKSKLEIQLNWKNDKDSIIYRELNYWKEK